MIVRTGVALHVEHELGVVIAQPVERPEEEILRLRRGWPVGRHLSPTSESGAGSRFQGLPTCTSPFFTHLTSPFAFFTR